VLLPILAYFGAFKKLQASMNRPEVVIMPPPPAEKQPPIVKKQAQQKQAHNAAGKGNATKRAAVRNNLSQPRVVASRGPAEAGASGPVVNPNGNPNFKAGTLPTDLTAKRADAASAGGSAAGRAAPAPAPSPKAEARAAPEPAPAPKPAPPAPAPKPLVPVLTEVAATYNPSPTIPDDLRSEAMDTTVTAQFMVGTDGVPARVKIVKSSGNDQLDRLALDTARKWRFKPATRDGQPIESRVVLHIEFEVQ
jgi:protein TonB